ncbi:MAG: serine/threonine protein kinase, partial [Planctomycetota bacterium]
MPDQDHDPTLGPQDPHDAETIAPSSTPWSTPDIPDAYSPSDLDIGQELGPYKIIDVLGEGGFGSVYKAEQSRPVKRQVALKIIKLGMDTKRVIARFEAERQALAVMDHPGIAHVLDAGATETGRPYFVMELVKGIPFSEYCDTNNLKNRERLERFIEVCKAIQHAHHKGIIHRDLKPSNVLVAIQDNVATPKVIDFGIAKAMNQPLTEQTVYTQMQQLIGTPEYMSPEQAENSGLDIDTRSDIYSLGVMLFELLTGFTPFDAQELRQTAISDLPRKLREAPTPKPSMRLTQITETQADDAAKHHQLSRAQLRKELKGDLDWMVLKALEKDRTRRYDSATALADDIQRYLNDEP